MAKRKRRRKKKITYQSKETKVIIGLAFLLVSIVLALSALDDSNGDNLFTIAQNFFGQTLLLASFTSLNLSLYYLDVKYIFTKGSSLMAQTGLVFLYPTFLSSITGNERLAEEAAQKGLAGGQLGYFLSWEIFFDRPFAQFTPHIVGFVSLILLLIAISVSLEQIGNWLKGFATFIGNIFSQIIKRPADIPIEKGLSKIEETAKTATRFSDFRKENEDKESKELPKGKGKDRESYIDFKKNKEETKEDKPKKVKKIDNVEIKEQEAPEDGLFAEELKYPEWQLPPVSLLSPYKKASAVEADTKRNSKIIEQTLASFNIDAKVAETFVGPSVVRYALDLPLGVKVAKVVNLSENLALALGVASNQIRIESIPGTTLLGIEAPRVNRDTVFIKEMIEELVSKEKLTLGVTIGKNIDGDHIMGDIKKMPHLLLAGATGSGKSVLVNSFIVSLLMKRTPDEVKLILVDPKQVELQDYNGIPHLLTPVITDMNKVVNALKWCVEEMEKRYTKFAEAKVRNIEGYNKKMGYAAVPYIVVVIDEMADMMMTADRNEAETAIVRLAQKARAVGIHLILATQRPSVNVITGIIKANIPGRIGMSVTSSTDSRVILDQIGAESLLGNGDLLYKAPDKTKSARIQSPLVTQEEIEKVVGFIQAQAPEVSYATSILESASADGQPGEIADLSDDDLFTQAVKVVVNYQKGSSSFLQRRLNIGFNRAARLLDEMEEAGVVGPPNGSKPREVLINDVEAFFASLSSESSE